MLEYFTYKKIKKHQEKAAKSGSPVLSPKDEEFLQKIVSPDEDAPPLPPRHPDHVSGEPTGNDDQVVLAGQRGIDVDEDDGLTPADVLNGKGAEETPATETKGKGKEKEGETPKKGKENKRFSFLQVQNFAKNYKFKKDKDDVKGKDHEKSASTATKGEDGALEIPISGLTTPSSPPPANEEKDITEALDKLNLAALNNTAFSLSAETRALLQKFTVILKDLVNGVPTAYDDLVHLLDDSQNTLQKSYNHLPSYLQKLVATLPTKLTSSLGPELLAVAAESQGLKTASATATSAGKPSKMKSAAKAAMKIPSLKDLVTKQGAVVGMLRAIMNVLKLRWPAFVGTNVLWSLGLFVLLFVFWYCHKRGKEVRLEKESKEEEERVRGIVEGGEASGDAGDVTGVGGEGEAAGRTAAAAVAGAPVPAVAPVVGLTPVEHAGPTAGPTEQRDVKHP